MSPKFDFSRIARLKPRLIVVFCSDPRHFLVSLRHSFLTRTLSLILGLQFLGIVFPLQKLEERLNTVDIYVFLESWWFDVGPMNRVAPASRMYTTLIIMHRITSFGILGATLFPDRTERMVLDGNSDTEEYFAGTWYTSLADADETLRYFFQTCYEMGPNRCPFYTNSTQAMEVRYSKLLADIYDRPIEVADPALFHLPFVVTSAELREATISSLYGPQTQWLNLAQMLKGLESRNGTLLAMQRSLQVINANNTPSTPHEYYVRRANQRIACIDANGRYKIDSIEKWAEHVEHRRSLSSYFGVLGTDGPIQCTAMGITPPPSQQFPASKPYNHPDPITSAESNAELPDSIKTDFPILFTSARLDPVTPLRR